MHLQSPAVFWGWGKEEKISTEKNACSSEFFENIYFVFFCFLLFFKCIYFCFSNFNTLYLDHVVRGSSQLDLNQLGLIPISPDPFCPFSTGPCFIGSSQFCPLVSSSCFISDSCFFVLDPFGPHPFRPWPNSPLISLSSWHFVFLFFVLCYFRPFPNCPLLLCPQPKSSFTA